MLSHLRADSSTMGKAAIRMSVLLTRQCMSAGGLLDENAARAALDSRRLGGSGLDVQANEPIARTKGVCC